MDFVGAELPRADELELSIFGTGRGECVVLHLGNGSWGLIDACRDPTTNDPLSLAYLHHLGIGPEAVVFLIATHWHDDHVDGLAETLAACSAADFGMSAALTGAEFRAVTLAAQTVGVSGVEELRACFDLIEAQPRRDGIRRAANRIVEDKRIWRNDDDSVVLTAVAPTNLAIQRSELDIARELLPTVERRRALGRATPNQASVAALLTTPVGNILLGGDVVERGAGGSGWSAIVAQQRRFSLDPPA